MRQGSVVFQLVCKRIGLVEQKHAVLVQLLDKFHKGIENIINIAVAIQMIVVDIIDKCMRRVQRQEAAYIFARLCNERVVCTDVYAAGKEIYHTAYVDRAVFLRIVHDEGQHGGDRCFPVATGDARHTFIMVGNKTEGVWNAPAWECHAPLRYAYSGL